MMEWFVCIEDTCETTGTTFLENSQVALSRACFACSHTADIRK
jgi:hypothetical protein